MKDYVVVVGGLNIDIAGLSGEVYREKDSNIGEVTINIGGVGQNIAQNLTKLDTPTHLITVYGSDSFGKIAQMECKKNNISLENAEQIENSRSSIYLYVNDNKGDLVTGINDMKICENITPEFLAKKLDFINGAKIVVVDCNLSQESIEWLCENVTSPIYVDPVSVAKVDRVKNVLDKIHTLKPNELEAELLTGIKITDEATAREAATALINKGVKNVYISLGSQGILCAKEGEAVLVKPLAKKIVSTNGAGDCSMGTLVWARFNHGEELPLEEVGLYTQAAASINVESPLAVSPELNVEEVLKRVEEK